jgi:hypothetical protein
MTLGSYKLQTSNLKALKQIQYPGIPQESSGENQRLTSKLRKSKAHHFHEATRSPENKRMTRSA